MLQKPTDIGGESSHWKWEKVLWKLWAGCDFLSRTFPATWAFIFILAQLERSFLVVRDGENLSWKFIENFCRSLSLRNRNFQVFFSDGEGKAPLDIFEAENHFNSWRFRRDFTNFSKPQSLTIRRENFCRELFSIYWKISEFYIRLEKHKLPLLIRDNDVRAILESPGKDPQENFQRWEILSSMCWTSQTFDNLFELLLSEPDNRSHLSKKTENRLSYHRHSKPCR